ncbi:MAG: hypothetical protein INF64_08495 [Roseomonas sp.]|nr:hypothetical protein [Roseomonas sp.]
MTENNTAPRLQIPQAAIDAFGNTLENRVTAYLDAIESHKFSIGIPRPSEHPLVEAIASAGGMSAIEIIPSNTEPSTGVRQVTNFQARALLLSMPGSAEGRTMFDDVDDALRAMGGVPWQAWEYTTIFPRDSALIAAIGTQFNLTEAQIDEMFIAAAAISA